MGIKLRYKKDAFYRALAYQTGNYGLRFSVRRNDTFLSSLVAAFLCRRSPFNMLPQHGSHRDSASLVRFELQLSLHNSAPASAVSSLPVLVQEDPSAGVARQR